MYHSCTGDDNDRQWCYFGDDEFDAGGCDGKIQSLSHIFMAQSQRKISYSWRAYLHVILNQIKTSGSLGLESPSPYLDEV